jgi:cystathionine gamma-lyase/cystathionine gamma-lyase/homocysteine desulfhydrase
MSARSTRALRQKIAVDGTRPTASPLFQTAAFQSGSAFFYSRKDNPNVHEFEDAMAAWEGARHALAVTTGMSALSLLMGLLRAGDTLVCHRLMYGCSMRLFQQQVDERGVGLLVTDLADPRELARLPASTRVVVFETPTNPFLRTVPIAAVAAAAHRANPAAVVAVDGTWATPLFQQPLRHGADVVLHSATKFISGHSDVMGGVLLCERDDLAGWFRERRFYHGANLDPHSAWLLARSLKTFPLRMREHARVTRAMVALLRGLAAVERVDFPQVGDGQLEDYGGIVFVQLRAAYRERYADLVAGLRFFDTGTGMAAVTSMIAQPWSGSHASLDDAQKAAMGLDRGLVRLCFGLEDEADLAADLTRAFAALESSPSSPAAG